MKSEVKKQAKPSLVTVPGWGDWTVWVNVILLLLTLGVAVYSIEQAQWIMPQPPLTFLLFLSVAVVRLLTAVRLRGTVVHVLVIFLGVLVTMWQGLRLLPDTAPGFGHLIEILSSWWRSPGALAEGEVKIFFGVFIALLTWLVGYLSTWFVLRKHNAWVAVSLGMVIILVNLSNLPEKTYIFFLVFLLAAVLLIVQTRNVRQQSLAGRAAPYPGASLLYLVVSLLCITALAASLSWVTPQLRVAGLQNTIATMMPWKRDIQESGINIFNAVPSKKSLSTTSTLKDLPFPETWHTGDEVNFTVISDRPAYWQMNVYDTYTPGGWEHSPTSEYSLEKKEHWQGAGDAVGGEEIKYKVISGISTDFLLISGGFIYAEMPVMVHVGAGEEITAVTSPRVLSPGESYTVRSFVSDPSEGALSAAGDNYSDSIKAVYLQLPPDFSQDIRLLSENITREAKTPYAKVVAIDDYLSGFTYRQEVDSPPEGTDSVEYFLLKQKSGFCLHFASAMAVMLRSVGVPARLAVGYLPGDPGEKRGEYLLRDRQYHAWPQVYFPGYGWVDFEATPSSPGSQVSIEAPLVSVPDIRELPRWNIWFYPPEEIQKMQNSGFTETNPESQKVRTRTFSFADELGRVLLIIFSIAAIIGLVFGLIRIIKSVFSRRLWHVDRDALASLTYENLCRLSGMMSLTPDPRQTPLEFSARIAAVIPEQSQALDYLVRSYLETRFSPRKGKPELHIEAEILKARRLVYDAILTRVGVMKKLLDKGDRY